MATKVKLAEATKELGRKTDEMLENSSRVRKSLDSVIQSLRRKRNQFRLIEEEEQKKKEHARDWRALALGCGAIGLILFFAEFYFGLFNQYQFMSIGCTICGFGLCCGSRYFDLLTKISGTRTSNDLVLSGFMKIGTFLLILFGWYAITTYGTLANIYGKTALVISCLTTIAVILLWTVFRPRFKKR